MDTAFDTLVEVFADTKNQLKPKLSPNYLDIKNGKLTYKIGYQSTLDPCKPLPSLVLDTNSRYEEYCLQSTSIPTKFNFS